MIDVSAQNGAKTNESAGVLLSDVKQQHLNNGGTHGFDSQNVVSTVTGTEDTRIGPRERESIDAREGLQSEIGNDIRTRLTDI